MTILKTILLENNLEEGLKLLTQREKKIISLYYLEGYKKFLFALLNIF